MITPYLHKDIIATKDTKDDFIEAGVPASYIKVTGIPIADKFEESIDKEEWLSQQHLEPFKTYYINVSRCIWCFKRLTI